MRAYKLVFLSLLVTFAAAAAPTISGIDPTVGFAAGSTHATITGSGFVTASVTCPVLPPPPGTGPATCPVQVFVAGIAATVHQVTPSTIAVEVNPPASTNPENAYDVEVRAASGNATLPGAFRFSDFAQPGPENYVTYVLPLAGADTPGANGSLWRTEWLAYNASSTNHIQLVGPIFSPLSIPTPAGDVPPRATVRLEALTSTEGAFVYVPAPLNDQLTMSLHVRDVSRAAEGLGTDVPILRSSDFKPVIKLIGVPTDARYRARLRIYGFTEAPQTVRVSVYVEAADGSRRDPIAQFDVETTGFINIVADPFPYNVGSIALDLLTPELRAASPSLRIEIDNLGENISPPPPNIWAFVSITNNDTQQVTLITPQR
ncbi:MAG: IPT/TIG domain-containing protein [Acidobacteria bacterium]|nr:IPT/TIG domain-containing protein [Acidobacteriota bacterium]MBV9475235.1 IPT/TIG domain-containing protein [Acidobacteriota bacterium]